jgi:hypothetical protein
MSSSTKKEDSHDPREVEPRQRMSSRLNRKHLGSHFRKSSTSTEAKLPKIVKSSSSTESPSLKHSAVLTKIVLKLLKIMKIVRTVTIKLNHHLKFPLGFHQIYPQEMKVI